MCAHEAESESLNGANSTKLRKEEGKAPTQDATSSLPLPLFPFLELFLCFSTRAATLSIQPSILPARARQLALLGYVRSGGGWDRLVMSPGVLRRHCRSFWRSSCSSERRLPRPPVFVCWHGIRVLERMELGWCSPQRTDSHSWLVVVRTPHAARVDIGR